MAKRKKLELIPAKGIERDSQGRLIGIVGTFSDQYLDLPPVSASPHPVHAIGHRVRLLQCEHNNRRHRFKSNPDLALDMAWIRECSSVFNNLRRGCTAQELVQYLPVDLAREVIAFWSRAQRASYGCGHSPTVEAQERLSSAIDAWAVIGRIVAAQAASTHSVREVDEAHRANPVIADNSELLVGWKPILKSLAGSGRAFKATRSEEIRLRRANEEMAGPIKRVGRRPEVHERALHVWWHDVEGRAAAAQHSRSSRDANRKDLKAGNGASLKDQGMHKERRPNSHGRPR